MAIWFVFNEWTVFLVLLGISAAERDLLDTLHVDRSNPTELNEFLSLLLRYKDEFRWIRQAVNNVSNQEGSSDLHNDFSRPSKPNDFSFLKRSAVDGRPKNDVYPYTYLKANGNGARNSRNLRRKRKRCRGRRRQRRSNVSVSFNVDAEQDSGEVKVVPRSETGVQSVPGSKYGSKNYEKREQKFLNMTSSSDSKLRNSSGQDPEYYYTPPHNELGLAQDLSREFEDRNMSCVSHKNKNPCRNAPHTHKKEPPHIGKKLKRKLLVRHPSTSSPVGRPQFQQPPQNITRIENPKIEEVESYEDSPQRTAILKQELLKYENDNVLANIDRLLKSDRSDLKMYRGIPSFQPVTKTQEEEIESVNPSFSLNHAESLENFNNFKGPAERFLKRIRTVDAQKRNTNVERYDSPINVELSFNSEAQEESGNGVKARRGHGHLHKSKANSKLTRIMIPIQPGLTPVSFAINGNDLVKLHPKNLKNKDDISDDLKATVKAYDRRQKEYKDKVNDIEDGRNEELSQEKKNLLEDQSEPTSAAEQRELGRQDEFVTPSMNESDDQAQVVIPLKKAANADRNDFETSKDGGFKVKESKDVIHIKGHRYISDTKDNIEKKEIKPEEGQNASNSRANVDMTKPEEGRNALNSRDNIDTKETKYDVPEDQVNALYTKEVLDKIKNEIVDNTNQNDYTDTKVKRRGNDGDYEDIAEENSAKPAPSNVANLDYSYYENFDQKREAPAIEATMKFQPRQLKSYFDVDLDYRNGNDGDYGIRKKRDDSQENLDSDEETEKRSEDDDSDEEPGNDSKNASYKNKTKEENFSDICKISNATGNDATDQGTIKFELTTTYTIKLSDLLNKTGFGSSSGETSDKDEAEECRANVSSSSNGETNADKELGDNDSFNSDDMDEPTFGFYGSDSKDAPKKSATSYNYFNVTINLAAPQECETTTANDSVEQFSPLVKKVNSTKLFQSSAPSPQAAHGSSLKEYFSNENKYNETSQKVPETEPVTSQTTNASNITTSVPNADSEKQKPPANRSFIENGFDMKCFSKNYLLSRGKNSLSTPGSVETLNSYDDEDEIDRNDKMHDSGSEPNVNKPVLDKENAENDDEKEQGDEEEEPEDDTGFSSKQHELLKKLKQLIDVYEERIKDLDNVTAVTERDILNKVHGHGKGKKKKKPTTTPSHSTVPKATHKMYPEKHVLGPQKVKGLQVVEEGYYEPESMADDLKERLLVEKLYNAVMKKRRMDEGKRAHFEYYGDYKETCPVDFEEDEEDSNADPLPKQRKNKDESDKFHKRHTKNPPTRWKQTPQSINHARALQKLRENKARKRLASNLIKKEAIRLKLDDVDSFKDVVEHEGKANAKRAARGSRNLRDFTESYLSPLVENDGIVNYRKRRRLKYLDKNNKVARQVNNNHYFIKNANVGEVPQKNMQMLNFIRNQNSNVKSSTAVPESDSTGPPMQATTSLGFQHKHRTNTNIPCSKMGSNGTVNCTEVDALRFNQSVQMESAEKIVEHESMRNMLNGNLALKLIDVFITRLKHNPTLYNRFGKFVSRTCAEEDVKEIKDFREEQARDDVKQAEEMLHEIILMLNKISVDQVNRKTCLQLSPNLKTFIASITKNSRNFKKNNQLAEGFPLPKIKGRNGEQAVIPPVEEEQGDFLFEMPESSEHKASPKLEVNKKIKLIEKLLDKYQRMSMNCQVQVEPVRQYLMEHLGMLMHLKEKSPLHSTVCVTSERSYTVNVKEQEIAPPEVHHNKSPALAETQKFISEATEPQSETLLELDENSITESTPRAHQLNLTTSQLVTEPKEQPRTSQFSEQPSEQTLRLGPSKPQSFAQPYLQFPMETQEEDVNNADQFQIAQLEQSGMQIPPPQAKPQHSQNLNSDQKNVPVLVNSSETTESIVAKQLQNGANFTNPELVSKNLQSLGLGGANSYLPPFDINGMVRESMTKTQIGQAGKLPQPKIPANPPSGRSRRMTALHDGKIQNHKGSDKGKEDKTQTLYEQSYAVDDDKIGNIKSVNQVVQDLLKKSGDGSVFDAKR